MKNLSYSNCNIDTIILFWIIFPTMFFTIIIIKLFVIGEIYKERHGCWPISYYFGEKSGCQRMIYQNIELNQENFISRQKNKTILFQIKRILFIFEYIWLLWKDLNISLSKKILQGNQYIIHFFVSFYKEII